MNLYLYSIYYVALQWMHYIDWWKILFQRLFPVLTCSGYWAQPQIHLCQTWFIFHFRYFHRRWELHKGYIPVSSFKQFLESLAGSFTCVEGLVKIQFGLLISKGSAYNSNSMSNVPEPGQYPLKENCQHFFAGVWQKSNFLLIKSDLL